MRAIVPTRALLLLIGIASADLVMTAVLHAQGMIVELNPLMKGLIERSEWLFVAVKGLTILAAWAAIAWYAPQNPRFVRSVCIAGSLAYLSIWTSWFVIGSL